MASTDPKLGPSRAAATLKEQVRIFAPFSPKPPKVSTDPLALDVSSSAGQCSFQSGELQIGCRTLHFGYASRSFRCGLAVQSFNGVPETPTVSLGVSQAPPQKSASDIVRNRQMERSREGRIEVFGHPASREQQGSLSSSRGAQELGRLRSRSNWCVPPPCVGRLKEPTMTLSRCADLEAALALDSKNKSIMTELEQTNQKVRPLGSLFAFLIVDSHAPPGLQIKQSVPPLATVELTNPTPPNPTPPTIPASDSSPSATPSTSRTKTQLKAAITLLLLLHPPPTRTAMATLSFEKSAPLAKVKLPIDRPYPFQGHLSP